MLTGNPAIHSLHNKDGIIDRPIAYFLKTLLWKSGCPANSIPPVTAPHKRQSAALPRFPDSCINTGRQGC